MAEELNTKVSRMEATLQRISAPNMKALEKYVGLGLIYTCTHVVSRIL